MNDTSFREQVFEYVRKKYKSPVEALWARFPDYAVFRHEDNGKWYGLVMDVPRNRLGLPGEERVDILNVKLPDPLFRDLMIQKEGYFRGYHISRGNWMSILLDGTVPFSEVCGWIDTSYETTASKAKKKELRAPKEWIVPANPAYYDIEHAFDQTDTIDWKQGRGIKTGDTVYMYIAAPVSAILYKCTVTETDIPCDFEDDRLTIKALMRIRLEKRFPPDRFTFHVLQEKYDIFAVRGPRGVPEKLREDLNI